MRSKIEKILLRFVDMNYRYLCAENLRNMRIDWDCMYAGFAYYGNNILPNPVKHIQRAEDCRKKCKHEPRSVAYVCIIHGDTYILFIKDHIEKIDFQELIFAVVNWPNSELNEAFVCIIRYIG